jgi:hypothetical protein
VRFCPWYPLAEAAAAAPAAPGVLQLRLATGLLDYPTGKSARVHYAAVEDVRAAAVALAAAHVGRGLVCRHLIEIGPDEAVDPARFCAKLEQDFVQRFGARPSLPPR